MSGEETRRNQKKEEVGRQHAADREAVVAAALPNFSIVLHGKTLWTWRHFAEITLLSKRTCDPCSRS